MPSGVPIAAAALFETKLVASPISPISNAAAAAGPRPRDACASWSASHAVAPVTSIASPSARLAATSSTTLTEMRLRRILPRQAAAEQQHQRAAQRGERDRQHLRGRQDDDDGQRHQGERRLVLARQREALVQQQADALALRRADRVGLALHEQDVAGEPANGRPDPGAARRRARRADAGRRPWPNSARRCARCGPSDRPAATAA